MAKRTGSSPGDASKKSVATCSQPSPPPQTASSTSPQPAPRHPSHALRPATRSLARHLLLGHATLLVSTCCATSPSTGTPDRRFATPLTAASPLYRPPPPHTSRFSCCTGVPAPCSLSHHAQPSPHLTWLLLQPHQQLLYVHPPHVRILGCPVTWRLLRLWPITSLFRFFSPHNCFSSTLLCLGLLNCNRVYVPCAQQ
ncbi:hypothetical protein E2C01_038293 [Portunus trituberculatus]|uniref:Uncharacterized protein n=1 Tax=Portunus trituberculatus TaxID=210409 RepID=A0A5B7FGF6_PORTR|nr:hypothetical protein [Portunus trituberculatus]